MDIRKPNKKETELKNIAIKEVQNTRAQLLIKQPFIGMIAMRLELITVIDSRLPTASTDANSVFFNARFLLSLNTEERISLLAHEIWHCVLLHFKRKGNREHQRFNYAADLEVDFMLIEQGFKGVKLLPYNEYYRGKNAEAIYDLLEKDVKRNDKADVHIYLEDNQSKSDTDHETQGKKDNTDTEIFIIDDDYTPLIQARSERKWKQWVISAAQQIERSQGNLPNYLKNIIKQHYKPTLDWREVLQQFVTSCFGGERKWLPPARRYVSQGLYLPGRKDEFLSVVVAIDTSASTHQDLPDFLSELKALITSFGRYEVTIIQCDMEIHDVKKYNEWDSFEFEEYEFNGFGGTSFIPVFNYLDDLTDNPNLLIYFTDGYGDAPSKAPAYPVLWLLTHDGEKPTHWGWKTYIEQSSYDD